ncbi:hypothetical protein [Nocardia farcinica]|uniref:hypothetical protein n=1 Tax=Nocardia farcinica TaxID=37329 RepID=UPI001E3F8D4D|nr:hypothetical protein [Nocardia farcinica]
MRAHQHPQPRNRGRKKYDIEEKLAYLLGIGRRCPRAPASGLEGSSTVRETFVDDDLAAGRIPSTCVTAR